MTSKSDQVDMTYDSCSLVAKYTISARDQDNGGEGEDTNEVRSTRLAPDPAARRLGQIGARRAGRGFAPASDRDIMTFNIATPTSLKKEMRSSQNNDGGKGRTFRRHRWHGLATILIAKQRERVAEVLRLVLRRAAGLKQLESFG